MGAGFGVRAGGGRPENGAVHYVAVEAREPGVEDAEVAALLDEDEGRDLCGGEVFVLPGG